MTDMITENNTEITENKPVYGTQDKSEKQERLFTQKELEEIISERLKRERKTSRALEDVKRLLKTVSEKGLVDGNSYSQMAEDLCKKLCGFDENEFAEQTTCAKEDCENYDESENNATQENCSQQHEEKVLCDKSENKNEEEKEHTASDAVGFAQTLAILREKYSDEDIGFLLSDGLFESFAKGRQGSTVDVFGDFCTFMGKFHNSMKKDSLSYEDDGEDEDYCEKDEDSYYSTAFSSHASHGTSYEDGLTKQQMDIAKSAGMSYREYAELLDNIPKNRTRKA